MDKNRNTVALEGWNKNGAASNQGTRKNAKGSASNAGSDSSKKIMGHALTIKEEYIRQEEEGDASTSSFQKLLEICQRVRESAAATLNENGSKVRIYSQFLDSSCVPCGDFA